MYYELLNDEDKAVLRSDDHVPYLELTDLSSSYNQELKAFRDFLPVYAVLTGFIGSAQLRTEIMLDEIDALISQLEDLLARKNVGSEWSTYDEQMKLEFTVDYEKLGPPVLCKASLTTTPFAPALGSSEEQYECVFYTNLTWIGIFLAELQRMRGRSERLGTQ